MRTIFIDFGNVLGFFDHRRAVAQLVAHSPLDTDALDHAVYGGEAMDDYESGRLSTAEFFEISRVKGAVKLHASGVRAGLRRHLHAQRPRLRVDPGAGEAASARAGE